MPIYLETGRHRPEQLPTILAYKEVDRGQIDSIGVDIKLPTASGENSGRDRSNFLPFGYAGAIALFVKLIISISSRTSSASITPNARAGFELAGFERVPPQIIACFTPNSQDYWSALVKWRGHLGWRLYERVLN